MLALDYNTLLLTIGLSGFCLSATLFASWLAARLERFMLSWSIGIGLVVAAVCIYAPYVKAPHLGLATAWFTLLLSGLAFIYGAAYRFRTGLSSRRMTAISAVAASAICLPPLALGYDGIGFILLNATGATLLGLTAYEYWKGRAEALLPITSIAVLYSLTGLSFVLCGAVLVSEGQWVIGHAPQNWAEDLNLVIAIIGITGIGAMSLALNQWRIAGSHRRDAMTDPLTGLLNRRALFDQYGSQPVGPHTAIIAFDLDSFKAINDRHGHAAGDEVLRVFANVLASGCRETDTVARLGGEEFAVVLHRTLPERATSAAERIRKAFAEREIVLDAVAIRCTVSAGIAFGAEGGLPFDTVLNQADRALYASKSDGRNRVSLSREPVRLAG